MPSEKKSVIEATDLPIALYLNQRLTFDLLAVLRGGFARFSTVQTTSSDATGSNLSGGAQLGISNAFALLGVNLGGQASRHKESERTESHTEEIIHTPASLFAQLRTDLRDRDLVHDLTPSSQLQDFQAGAFIEFQATLRRSPILDMLETFSALLPIVDMNDSNSTSSAQSSGKRKNRGANVPAGRRGKNSELADQMELIKSVATSAGSLDFIAELCTHRLVLTIEKDYFIDPSMNDIIDGTFRVFGKITRVVLDKNQSISLLRKTAIGKFIAIETAMEKGMQGLQESGFTGATETEVHGPTMQVIPIAIFS